MTIEIHTAMIKDELLKVINDAAENGVEELDLSGNELTELPPEIGKLTQLKKLILGRYDISQGTLANNLDSLPIEITQLTQLQELSLSYNQFDTIPSEIFGLEKLEALNISDNKLDKIPVEINQLTQLKKLDISNNNFASFPIEITKLNQLHELYINGNSLSHIPLEICQLSALQELDISRNKFTNIPVEIYQSKQLKRLSIRGTKLTSIPVEIAQLTQLETLRLSDNKLTDIPVEIAQLTQLKTLNLSDNELTNIPVEIAKLTQLETLRISNNRLANIPDEIGELRQLDTLEIYNNKLTFLFDQVAPKFDLFFFDLSQNKFKNIPTFIFKQNNLLYLNISNNKLSYLPSEIVQLRELRGLDLSNNILSRLPAEITQLQKLKHLNLKNNPLPIPPEILDKVNKPEEIINYYWQKNKESLRPLNEAKVLLVGEAKVGKTSLVKKLIEGTFNPNERMTEGINIRKWSNKIKGQDVQLNVWDFGGQEIMHATHQFFLTKRSLYLLVLNARQDEDGNRLEYWLKIIRSFSGNSPVIIVGNQIDQKPLDINRRGLQKKYPNIVGFVETSCSDPNHKGIEKLKKAISEQIGKLPHVFDTLPASWFAVKSALEKIDADYIEYQRYQQICNEKNVTKEQSQKTLIGFLNDLGIALNFSDDPRLNQDNILNPEWVTNGVYSILNDNALMTQHKGILERSMLPHILDDIHYPADKHLFIIDMMKKFELCFPLEGFEDDKYLLPDLLSKEEPETGYWHDALPFQYHYNILPSSIISRFIVRMNQLISRRTYWRNGVVLKKGGNKALVKADREERKIFIWVSGNQNTRRILLESIRDQFDYIHKSIPGIEVNEKVPLPKKPDVFVDYKHLLDMEELGVEEFVPDGLKEQVKVRDLLQGIETFDSRQERLKLREELGRNFEPSPPAPDALSNSTNKSRSPWKSGIFYFLLLAAITTLLTIISQYVAPLLLPVVIIATLLAFGLIGAFVLMQDERFSEENFVTLFTEVFKRLFLLRGNDRDKNS